MRPDRLHHNAYVSKDLESTRAFYEDVVGLPLVTTWREGEGENAYCHLFFELEDGSALAFFQFANPETSQLNQAAKPKSPFYHIALNASAECQAAVAAKATERGIDARIIDHGYCTSLYMTDPDDMTVELTVDTLAAAPLLKERRKDPHRELAEWLAGDHTPNNEIRHS
ncbi:MAG: VOC family protein [Pseudomonadota bacterium]